jgi:hypothetical protein
MRMYDIVVSLDTIFANNRKEALKMARKRVRSGMVSLDVAYESDKLDDGGLNG